jgi:hypothetical protein
MPNPRVVVDVVHRLSSSLAEMREARRLKPTGSFVTVELQDGTSGRLDMSQSRSALWAEVLHSMQEAGQPAYIEMDPGTRIITELLVPVAVRVGAIKESASKVEVELIISHARHYVQHERPNFNELLAALKSARSRKSTVWVTETDDHQIIDVRPAGKSAAQAPLVS